MRLSCIRQHIGLRRYSVIACLAGHAEPIIPTATIPAAEMVNYVLTFHREIRVKKFDSRQFSHAIERLDTRIGPTPLGGIKSTRAEQLPALAI